MRIVLSERDGSAQFAEMTAREFARKSQAYKELVDGRPYVLVWCSMHRRTFIPVVLLPDPVVVTSAPAPVPFEVIAGHAQTAPLAA